MGKPLRLILILKKYCISIHTSVTGGEGRLSGGMIRLLKVSSVLIRISINLKTPKGFVGLPTVFGLGYRQKIRTLIPRL